MPENPRSHKQDPQYKQAKKKDIEHVLHINYLKFKKDLIFLKEPFIF